MTTRPQPTDTRLHCTATEAQTGRLSPFWARYLPGAYDRRCTCCLLGQDHTEARHAAEIAQTQVRPTGKE
jgi:hypothetical protein